MGRGDRRGGRAWGVRVSRGHQTWSSWKVRGLGTQTHREEDDVRDTEEMAT